MSKKDMEQLIKEVAILKAFAHEVLSAIDTLNNQAAAHSEQIGFMSSIVQQMLSEDTQTPNDERNAPHEMPELEDMTEYVMPDDGTIWIHGSNIRLLIEEVQGDIIVQAFKNTELEKGMPPFSMMRASAK